MTGKPTTAAGYPPEMAEEARSMCLFVATILGDLWDDVVVIGGLVGQGGQSSVPVGYVIGGLGARKGE